MNRRQVCATAVISLAGLTGCLSGSDTGTERTVPPGGSTEPAGTDPHATDDPAPTGTATIPPYDRKLSHLRIENERDQKITVEVAISVDDGDESRTFTTELDAGSNRLYEDLSILERQRQATVVVDFDGGTYEYSPGGEGMVNITITPAGVEFEEMVT